MGLSPVALFEAIYRDVPQADGLDFQDHLYPGTTYRQFASSYLLSSVIRKWIPRNTKDADAAALEAFTSANNRCRDWRLVLETEEDSLIFGEIRKILDDFFHPQGEPLVQSYFDLLGRGRPGPGVAVGAIGTSYYSKYFASPLTCTSQYLYEEYKSYAEWIPNFSEAECLRYEKNGPPHIVSGSRCSFVPKTNASSRMICIEPSLNMYYQLGLATIMEDRLKRYFGIDLERQPDINRRLARKGSLDDSLATIDLSSASDSISLRLCEELLPTWLFDMLLTLRSRDTVIDDSHVPLFMISTMGNGFTFPLQTIIFSAVLKAVSNVLGTKSHTGNWSCFGDDLICEKHCFSRVIRTLGILGFSINPKKTFFEGPFRESCGADWFLGQPVRPVFVKKLDTPYDIFVAINQLNDWSAYTGIPLWNTIRFLVSSLEQRFLTFVPYESAYDSGIRVPVALINPKRDSNQSWLYKSWERKGSSIRIGEGEVRLPAGRGKLQFNPSGLYCSFLFGELVSFTIMVRHNRKMYRKRLRCTPRWDYIPTGSLTNGVRLSWQQWETAVVRNWTKP